MELRNDRMLSLEKELKHTPFLISLYSLLSKGRFSRLLTIHFNDKPWTAIYCFLILPEIPVVAGTSSSSLHVAILYAADQVLTLTSISCKSGISFSSNLFSRLPHRLSPIS